MAITNASRLADFGSGIGTEGAVLQVDNVNDRVGIGTTNPQAMLQVGTGVSVYGNSGIVSATSFYGDGTNLTNVGVDTATVNTDQLNVIGVATVGSGVTINSTGIQVTSGIITAGTCFKAGGGSFGPGIGATILGSGNAVFAGIVTAATTLKVGVGATIHGSSGNAVFAGIVTATTLKYGTTSVETAIDAKASTGKAIAMAMVFGF